MAKVIFGLVLMAIATYLTVYLSSKQTGNWWYAPSVFLLCGGIMLAGLLFLLAGFIDAGHEEK